MNTLFNKPELTLFSGRILQIIMPKKLIRINKDMENMNKSKKERAEMVKT